MSYHVDMGSAILKRVTSMDLDGSLWAYVTAIIYPADPLLKRLYEQLKDYEGLILHKAKTLSDRLF